MWCIPALTPECIGSMEERLDLDAKPHHARAPVRCVDEQSKPLLKDTRPVKNTKAGKPRRRDDDYERSGTSTSCVTVEPNGGSREVSLTNQRKTPDVAQDIARIIKLHRDRHATTIPSVLDHLNTHFENSFIETFGTREANHRLSRIRVHDTPKHASWLKMAESEIGMLSRQSIQGRIPPEEKLRAPTRLWQARRNGARAMSSWTFTVRHARATFQSNSRGSKLN